MSRRAAPRRYKAKDADFDELDRRLASTRPTAEAPPAILSGDQGRCEGQPRDTRPARKPSPLEALKVCELWDGWESVQNYALIRGRIEVGKRVTRRLPRSSMAKPIPELERAAPTWPYFRKRKPIASGGDEGTVAETVFPYDEHYGFAVALVQLADEICGSGGWRAGTLEIASPAPVLAKVLRGEPVALIAAARIEWWVII